MTLRSLFRRQQLISAFVCIAAFGLMESAARAQDTLIMQDGRQQAGKILGVVGTGIQLQIGQGTIGIPMATVKEVRMTTVPPEYAVAQRAMENKEYDKALAALKALEKYKGLPTEWAQQSVAMLGDVYVEKGDTAKAEAAYKDFQRYYPSAQGGPQSEIGLARLAASKKDFATAKAKVEPVIAKAQTEKNVPRALGSAYSQAFYLMGQIKESEGDLSAALENYLKTVAVFYHDRGAVALAQEKANALRKEHPELFVP